ncbi:GroES-like protein [Setomelanomma holmii]|uniref:GroES-like protein n=1 Tax=Setomelanomma holmii TaxID=210430 RepID=A0A9P4HF45_9PLEO|nr:GroES-like protein [Setomelanomma holmii]
MKAITITHQGAAPQVSTDIAIPRPGEGQILVKTLYAAINPVDAFMQTAGLLVHSWPFTPGCDSCGVIEAVGPHAISALGTEYKVGEHVFGCTRVGVSGHATFAEHHLFDAALCFPVPKSLSFPEAASSGAAILTAALGVYDALGVAVPDPSNLPARGSTDVWALVFGGAGSVGQFAVQLLVVAGFKVVTTSSEKSFGLLKALDAHTTLDYKTPEPELVASIQKITNGNLAYSFDAVSVNNGLVTAIDTALGSASNVTRRYTTTNDWEPLPALPHAKAKAIELGPIGQPEAVELNSFLKSVIPVLYKLLEQGTIKPSAYSVEGEGIEGIVDAWEVQKSGVKGSTKVVVKIIDE